MKKFNIRIYGLLINDKQEVLISDEERLGFQFTKFPGGGLEWGEGIIEGLKREFKEELNIEIDVLDLYYITDFFQVSAFHESDQLISIYYLVRTNTIEKIKINQTPTFDKNIETHRWLPLSNLDEKNFTFPIDKIVANKLSTFLLKKI
jgi:8-oxo-dGTP diphosphatase